MNKLRILMTTGAALCIACTVLPVAAKGCLEGAAVGGVGGHFVGHHAVAGAVVGCAVGHHVAAKKDRAARNAAAAQAGAGSAPAR